MGMDMDRFHGAHDSVSANSGMEFADVPRLLVMNGMTVRLVGDFQSVWEHFVTTSKGPRPYYCEGPESDCPICHVASRMAFSDVPETQSIGKDIKARERFYFNVLDRTPIGMQWHAANRKAKILVQNEKGLSIGSMLFKAIGDVVKMRRQQGQPDDPNGFDIMLSKSGSGMKTKYGAQFTGSTTPLTEEELAYELWPLDQMAKTTPRSEREAIANWIMGEGDEPGGDGTDFDPSKYQASGPVQSNAQAAQRPATSQVAARPSGAPGPAVAPGQAVATAPAAAPAPVQKQQAPAKLVVKNAQPQYQDTKPRDGADPSTNMVVPCMECQADMMIDMENPLDLKCHNCGKIYLHPSKG